MFEAEVGDDVYGEDPTINRLEQRAAEIFGREAALFVPSGTMGNQIAIKLHTHHGQEVICEERGHVFNYEMAMMAHFSGVVPRTVWAEAGVVTWKHVKSKLKTKSYHAAKTGLVSLENTHNMAGGTVTSPTVFNPGPFEICLSGFQHHSSTVHYGQTYSFFSVCSARHPITSVDVSDLCWLCGHSKISIFSGGRYSVFFVLSFFIPMAKAFLVPTITTNFLPLVTAV